jgi:hypothetical protein
MNVPHEINATAVKSPAADKHTPMMQHYRCVTFFCSAFPSIQSRAI